jgi:hypothetical protein
MATSMLFCASKSQCRPSEVQTKAADLEAVEAFCLSYGKYTHVLSDDQSGALEFLSSDISYGELFSRLLSEAEDSEFSIWTTVQAMIRLNGHQVASTLMEYQPSSNTRSCSSKPRISLDGIRELGSEWGSLIQHGATSSTARTIYDHSKLPKDLSVEFEKRLALIESMADGVLATNTVCKTIQCYAQGKPDVKLPDANCVEATIHWVDLIAAVEVLELTSVIETLSAGLQLTTSKAEAKEIRASLEGLKGAEKDNRALWLGVRKGLRGLIS